MTIIATSPTFIVEADLVRDSLAMPSSYNFGTMRIEVPKLPTGFDSSTIVQENWIIPPSVLYWVAVKTVQKVKEFNLPIIEGSYNPVTGTAAVKVPRITSQGISLPYAYWRIESPDISDWKQIGEFEYQTFREYYKSFNEFEPAIPTDKAILDAAIAAHTAIANKAVTDYNAKRQAYNNAKK